MTDQEALDEAKRRYLAAKADIERLRRKIANNACPLSVGDRVTVDDAGRTYEGVIESIDAAPSINDYLEPIVGAPTPWVANGRRINKTTGQVGKWGLSIPSDAEEGNGIWYIPERSIQNALGIAKAP